MTKEQITDYLKKHSINSKEELASHIQELKSNTIPNIALISELCYVLADFSFYFSPEKISKKEKNIMYLDEQLEHLEKNSKIINSTRHKNKLEPYINISVEEITNCKDSNKNFKCNKLNCGSCNETLKYFLKDNPQYYSTNINQERIECLNRFLQKTEEIKNINSTRHKSQNGETHTELPPHNLDYTSSYLENLKKIYSGEMNRPEAFTVGQKETEGKLFYELDFQFVKQMAERMQSNKENSKYEIWNWKKPMTPKGLEDLKQAMWRHIIAVMCGEFEDDGREFGHLEAISNNAMMINYQLNNVK